MVPVRSWPAPPPRAHVEKTRRPSGVHVKSVASGCWLSKVLHIVVWPVERLTSGTLFLDADDRGQRGFGWGDRTSPHPLRLPMTLALRNHDTGVQPVAQPTAPQ